MERCQFTDRLGAYHDGELDAGTRRQIERHLMSCTSCAAELAAIRGLSRRVTDARDEIAPEEMRRIGQALAGEIHAAESLRSLWPIARMLGALAASILIISGVWLHDLSQDRATATAGAGPVALAPEWERVAVTLRADPRVGEGNDSVFLPRYAAAVDWMVKNLTPVERKPWAKPNS